MKKTSSPRLGFTLVELIVSTAIISLIMLVLVSMTNQTSQMWQNTTEKIEKFEEARDAFESMTRQISQATLNTYWDYLDKNGNPRDKNVQGTAYKQFVPAFYGRTSELRFVSGPMSTFATDKPRPTHAIFFPAPLGVTDTSGYSTLDNLLNIYGYYLEVGGEDSRPSFIGTNITPARTRSRLMEFRQPSERMDLYDLTDNTYNWFTPTLSSTSRVLAENVIALIILPKLSKADQDSRGNSAPVLSPKYTYNSQLLANDGNTKGDANINPHNQLPPIVQVTMVAIDERSAQRFMDRNGGNSAQPQYIGPNPTNIFQSSTQLEIPPDAQGNGGGELATYEKALVSAGFTYRIFSTNVSIRGAKWSRSQTN